MLTGVMLITGEHGVGKTRFAMESGDITKTVLIDDDLKGRSTIERMRNDLSDSQIDLLQYIDFIQLCDNKKPLQIHEQGLKIIDELSNKTEVIIWDTWSRFAETCAAYVRANNKLFKDNWAAMGKIKAGEEYKQARLYEANLIARLSRKAKLVILTSHLKNQYLNNVATGKEIPAVSKAVNRVCNLRLWLRHNPTSSTPIALVLKNIEKNVLVDGRLRTIQVLPLKITPLNNEDCFERSLWDSITRYYDNPMGNHKQTLDEIPNDFEMSIVQGTLTEDQRLSWLYALKEKKQADTEEKLLLQTVNQQKAIELRGSGKNFPQIAAELELSVSEVVNLLKN